MEFATLNSYVTWRDEKRVEYKMLSQMLKSSRAALSSDAVKQASRNVTAELKAAKTEGRVPHWRALRISTAVTQHSRIALKAQATSVLKERAEAKKIAGESWVKWRESNQP